MKIKTLCSKTLKYYFNTPSKIETSKLENISYIHIVNQNRSEHLNFIMRSNNNKIKKKFFFKININCISLKKSPAHRPILIKSLLLSYFEKAFSYDCLLSWIEVLTFSTKWSFIKYFQNFLLSVHPISLFFQTITI